MYCLTGNDDNIDVSQPCRHKHIIPGRCIEPCGNCFVFNDVGGTLSGGCISLRVEDFVLAMTLSGENHNCGSGHDDIVVSLRGPKVLELPWR